MENYIKNYKTYDKVFVYDFVLGDGGIGDYLKFFMIILKYCIENNIRIYNKINNLEIEKFIKFKHHFFNITNEEISKLDNVTIKKPQEYYGEKSKYDGNINLNEVFDFDESVKLNVKNIIPVLPADYLSIHLRLGDSFLETDKKFVLCKYDTRRFSEEKMYEFIEKNCNKHILFFCENNNMKIKVKNKYQNIIITNSKIGHTSLPNTTSEQILDTVTDFYLLCHSQKIYAASGSGFSKMASKFKNIEYIS
jgi:hypothetical protein